MTRSAFFHVLWYALVLVLAFTVYGAQIDRQSEKTPALASSVPEPFRAFAQQRIVGDLIQQASAGDQDQRGAALAEARKLVRRRPVPAENLFLLAVAEIQDGAQPEGMQTLGLSGERGWRVALVQHAMIDFALSSKATDVAAARLLAIWSFAESEEDRHVLQLNVPRVFAAPGGPEAMGKVLASSHFAQNTVLREAPGMVRPDQYARMLLAAVTAGADFDCPLLEQQIRSVARHGDAEMARKIATHGVRACPGLTEFFT